MVNATPLTRRGQKGCSELQKSKPLFCLSSLIRLESKNNFLEGNTLWSLRRESMNHGFIIGLWRIRIKQPVLVWSRDCEVLTWARMWGDAVDTATWTRHTSVGTDTALWTRHTTVSIHCQKAWLSQLVLVKPTCIFWGVSWFLESHLSFS